jgi:acyl-CoA thioesterase-2
LHPAPAIATVERGLHMGSAASNGTMVPTAAPHPADDEFPMSDVSTSPLHWDGQNINELLTLEPVGDNSFRNPLHDGNPNGRAFGGQILGQALAAALQTVSADRVLTALQLLFLQGATTTTPVNYSVTALQDGKRFSSRHVRGEQAGRFICDAHASFQQEPAGLELAERLVDPVPEPEQMPTMAALATECATELEAKGWHYYGKRCLDMCLIDWQQHLFEPSTRPHMKFWLRLRGEPRTTPAQHYAALAYLSDYWITTSSMTPHRALTDTASGLYVASLNHGLWLHGPLDANDWLLFVSDNVRTTQGRGLVVAKVYDRSRHHVATITQECLITQV